MNPILLVHGFTDTGKVFYTLSTHLISLGYQVNTLNLVPNHGTAKLADLARQVEQYIDNYLADHQKINLLGFSMGGLVTRYYLQRLGGIEKVDKYISISAPNHGTLLAYTLPFKGIVDMRPNSAFLQDLNQDMHEQLGQIKCLTCWTPFDLMIIPAQSSKMGIGQDLAFPVLIHKWMLSDRQVLANITQFLD